MGKIRVGARTLTGDDVHELEVVTHCACRAYANDIVDIVEIVQLPAVDADCGNAHAGSHDGHGNALPCAGVTLNTSDVVHEHGAFQKGLGDELCAQGVTGHEHGLCDILLFGGDMRSGNRHNNSSYDYFVNSKANYNKQISKVKLQDAIIYDIIKIR